MRKWLFLPLVLLLAGCNDPYGIAAKLAQDVAVSDSQAVTLVDSLRVGGTLSPTEERSVVGWVSSLNTLNAQYISCVQVAHSSSLAGGFTKCATTFVSAMGDPRVQSALHISNVDSQQKVIAAVQAIETLINVTVTELGGR